MRRNYDGMTFGDDYGRGDGEWVFPPRQRCSCGGHMTATSTRKDESLRYTKCDKCGRTGKQIKVRLPGR